VLKRYVSISLRLTVWFGSIFFCGWVIFGTAMWLYLNRTLTEERHQTLSRRADRLQELLRRDQGAKESDRVQDFNDFAHATGKGLVEIFSSAGERVYPSPSAAASAFPWPGIVSTEKERFFGARYGGQSYRVLVHPFKLGEQALYLVMAAPEAANQQILNGFWRGLLASIPILLPISSAGGYWVSRRALRPVDRITASAQSISIRNLSERLPVNDSGDELQRLAKTCNDMLGRLELAVKRIKQFTADASHELRGPLSFTRTVAEIALRNPDADEKSRQAFRDIVDEAAEAAVLLEQMLTLARADAEPFGVALEPLSLVEVVEETCDQARKLADEKSLTMSVSIPPQPINMVLGDAPSLRRLLWILLDNALKYTNSPGRIDVSLTAAGARATLCVMDNGVGISRSDLPHIFDRFYRADPSRSQIEGAGLGLSIARWIAETHHAEISVVSQKDEGTTFKVVFPFFSLRLPVECPALCVPVPTRETGRKGANHGGGEKAYT
jgi:heavy metal sensor kinase